MKKAFPFVLGAIVLALLVTIMSSNAAHPLRRFDDRMTLRQRDKIPYGTRVARELLPSLFPNAKVYVENTAPGQWDSLASTSYNQAVIFITDYFNADKEELNALSDFVEKGNYVFIISRDASDEVDSFFHVRFENEIRFGPASFSLDSLRMRLVSPGVDASRLFVYPGLRDEGVLRPTSDSNRSAILGVNDVGHANFLQLKQGSGSFFLHSVPLAFSNYFILHKTNAAYYEGAMSVLPRDLSAVVWDEYYLQKPSTGGNPSWLKALFSYPAFKWGFLVGMTALALFVLLGMRRRQRMIPPHQKPVNDSLDFVKTLGRLYYDRRDHQNLAAKMAVYFLEHIRSKYKLVTHTLDEDFAQSLHLKSGYPLAETKSIVDTIQYIGSVEFIPESELAIVYQKLDAFYQNT